MPAFGGDHAAHRSTGCGEHDGTGNEQPPEGPARRERLALRCCASGAGQFAARRVPVIWRFREGRREDRVERSGQIRSSLGQTWRRLVQMREHDRQLALPVERPLTGQAFEEDAAERVLVGAAVDRPALDLFGRYVIDCADEAALAREAADRRDVAS